MTISEESKRDALVFDEYISFMNKQDREFTRESLNCLKIMANPSRIYWQSQKPAPDENITGNRQFLPS